MSSAMLHETPSPAKPVPSDWYASQDNVLTLIGWLNDQDYFTPEHYGDTQAIVRNVVYVIEKPAKFTDEYRRMVNGLAYDEERCPECHAPGDAMDVKRDGRCWRCEETAELAEAVRA